MSTQMTDSMRYDIVFVSKTVRWGGLYTKGYSIFNGRGGGQEDLGGYLQLQFNCFAPLPTFCTFKTITLELSCDTYFLHILNYFITYPSLHYNYFSVFPPPPSITFKKGITL